MVSDQRRDALLLLFFILFLLAGSGFHIGFGQNFP